MRKIFKYVTKIGIVCGKVIMSHEFKRTSYLITVNWHLHLPIFANEHPDLSIFSSRSAKFCWSLLTVHSERHLFTPCFFYMLAIPTDFGTESVNRYWYLSLTTKREHFVGLCWNSIEIARNWAAHPCYWHELIDWHVKSSNGKSGPKRSQYFRLHLGMTNQSRPMRKEPLPDPVRTKMSIEENSENHKCYKERGNSLWLMKMLKIGKFE